MHPQLLAPTALVALLILPGKVAGQIIDYTKVRQYVGEDVIVEGPVARVERGLGGVLRFSIGKTHGRRTLEVIIPAEFVNAFDHDIRWYEGKTVQVRGRIMTGEAEGIVRGRGEGSSTIPAIVLVDSSHLRVIIPPPPPPPGEKQPQ